MAALSDALRVEMTVDSMDFSMVALSDIERDEMTEDSMVD